MTTKSELIDRIKRAGPEAVKAGRFKTDPTEHMGRLEDRTHKDLETILGLLKNEDVTENTTEGDK